MQTRVKNLFLFFFILLVSINVSYAQDYITWTGLQFKKPFKKDYTFFIKPIVRHNLSEPIYLDHSPDYGFTYKVDKNWSTMILGRTWFIPNGPNRQFIFIDIKHAFQRSKIGVSNVLRIHHAFDIEREDLDFLRWQPTVSYAMTKKFKPLVGLQVFYRLYGLTEVHLIRYVAGFSSSINKKMGLNFQFWRQQGYNGNANNLTNILVTTLSYKL